MPCASHLQRPWPVNNPGISNENIKSTKNQNEIFFILLYFVKEKDLNVIEEF
jgi:hypothetical protein